MGPPIIEEWNKNIFSFVEFISFAPDEGFYCWLAGRGVKNVSTNILILKFVVLRLVIYSVPGTILEWCEHNFVEFRCVNLGTQIKDLYTLVSVENMHFL